MTKLASYNIGSRGSKGRVPQRDIGIVVWPVLRFFCFYTADVMNIMELDVIQNKIYEVRGVRVMLDFDLAKLYQVETRVLKQSVV